MAQGTSHAAPGRIYIEVSQPNDRGSFLIRSTDWMTQKVICEQHLAETTSQLQYLYTARLLEDPNSLRQNIASANGNRYADIVRYGQKLYTDLFGPKKELARYIKRSKHLQNGIHYILQLRHSASELWNIPWEYLHDGDEFVNLNPKNMFVRSLVDVSPDKALLDLRELPRPLKILVLIADPNGAPPLNMDQEVRNILDAVGPTMQAGLVTVDFIEEGSLTNLETMLAYEDYHILHYTGHGGISSRGSFLALEGDDGEVQPVFVQDLLPIIRRSNSLRLVVLSGCKTGQIEETQAMSGVAAGLLQAVPAVVAMQFTVLDSSAQVFGRSFFERIGRGETLESAVRAGRQAMEKAQPGLADWGVPALYAYKMGIRLIDPAKSAVPTAPTAPPVAAGLPDPPIFVGRRDEQRLMRRILPDLTMRMVYIWGMGGVGKSALAARLIRRPGRKGIIDSVLVIPCDQTKLPDVLTQLAAWLEPDFPQAAQAMRDPRLKPHERVQAAAQIVRRKRMILIFDRFEAYLQESTDRHHWDLGNPLVEQFFRALATAPWSIMTIFTSRYRWSLMAEIPEHHHIEIHLNTLTPSEVGMMLARLEHLSQIEMKALGSLLECAGGHPETLHLLEIQAAKDNAQFRLNLKRMPKVLVKRWHERFLGDAFQRLSEAERSTLLGLCVLEGAFWPGYIHLLAKLPDRHAAEAMMARWEALSLIHFLAEDEDGDPWYQVHQLVRTYLIHQCTPDQIRSYHRRAAEVTTIDLAEMALRRYAAHGGPAPIRDDAFMTARMEIRLILQQAHPAFGAVIVRRALDWRRHFMAVGDYEKAASIVNDTWSSIAVRYGDPETARQLLQETVDTTHGRQQLIARSNLAEFLLDDGKLDEAMRSYESVISEFLKTGDEVNAAVMLLKQSDLYGRLDKQDRAMRVADRALKLYQKNEDAEGESRALRVLGTLYMRKEKYKDALRHNEAAEKLLRGTNNWDGLCAVLQDRGIIYKRLNQLDKAIECFQTVYNIAEQIGNLPLTAKALSEAGELYRMVGKLNEASRFTLEAISIAERLNDQEALAIRIHRLSLIYELQRNLPEARAMSERALALAKQYNPSLVPVINEALKRQRRR